MPFNWNNFPYTNFHELNLDWFSEHFKEIFEEWEELYNTLTQWKDATDADLAQWKEDTLADMDTWERELLAALDEWKIDTGNDISDWESSVISDLNDWKETFLAAYESLENRVEAIVSDTENMVENLAKPFSTSNNYNAGDYVIYNGLLYKFTANHSAGAWTGSDAIQKTAMDDVTFIKDVIKEYNVYNICDDLTHNNSSPNGITFTWNSDGSCSVVGTASSAALNNMFASISELPVGIEAGEVYGIWNNAAITAVQVTDNTNGGYLADCRSNQPAIFKIPSNCLGITIRLYVASGQTVSEIVKPIITKLGRGWDRVILNKYSANTLTTDANNLIENVIAHNVSPYISNAPTYPGWIEVVKTTTNLVLQRYFPDSVTLHPIMIRTKTSDGWAPWVAIGSLLDTVTILPQITSIASYTRQSQPNTIYISDRIIPAGANIRKVNVYELANVTHKIYIIDAKTSQVLYKAVKDCVIGWNEIIINYKAEKDVIIGSDGAVAFNYGNAYQTYSLATEGLLEVSEKNPSVGDVVLIKKTAIDYYAFLMQWTYDLGNAASYTYTSEYNGVKLDNGNLLKYEILNSSEPGYVGRWFDYNGKKCANADGSEFYFRTKGALTITLTFGQITNQTVTPYYAYSVDGGAFTRKQISNGTITLPNTKEHNIRIVLDGMTEAQGGNKWNETLGVYVNSISVDNGTVIGILPLNKIGIFYGDSITEGVNALGSSSDASVNSAINSYPFFTCKYLNSVSYRVGYGSSGITVDGSFHKCIDAVDYDYNGQETGIVYPDFIVINHGMNDGLATGTEFLAGYKEVIERLRIKYGSVPIFCVSAMRESQPFWNRVEEAAKDYSNTYFISTAGWNGDTTDGIHLSRTGAKNNGKKLADKIIEILGKNFFI